MKRPPKEKKVGATTEVFIDYKESGSHHSSGDASKYEHTWHASKDLWVNDLWLDRKMASSYMVETMQCEGKVKAGDIVYLIVVRYSDGDTFGHSTGNYHFELATKDANKAVEVKSAIQAGTYEGEDSRRGYLPWTGYFNSLEDVELHKMVAG